MTRACRRSDDIPRRAFGSPAGAARVPRRHRGLFGSGAPRSAAGPSARPPSRAPPRAPAGVRRASAAPSADRLVDRADADAHPLRRGVGAVGRGAVGFGVEGGHAELLAEPTHADGGSGLTVPRPAARVIHGHRELAVGPPAAELAHDLHRAWAAIRGAATSPSTGHPDLGVPAADPVDRRNRLRRPASSRSTITSSTSRRTRRCLARASVPAASQARGRSWARRSRAPRSISGRATTSVSSRAMRASSSATRSSAAPLALFEGAGDVALRGVDVLAAHARRGSPRSGPPPAPAGRSAGRPPPPSCPARRRGLRPPPPARRPPRGAARRSPCPRRPRRCRRTGPRRHWRRRRGAGHDAHGRSGSGGRRASSVRSGHTGPCR